MTALPPEPITVAAEWVASVLRRDADVTGQIGARSFFAYAPPRTATPFLTHDLAAAETAQPLGPNPPAGFVLGWELTAWTDGQAIQQLRRPMQAALAALVGADLSGRGPEPFASADGATWAIGATYAGPVPAPTLPSDVTGEGAWARIVHAIQIVLQAT